MKIESNLLNISMPKNDRVQEAAKPDTRSSARSQSNNSTGDGVVLGSQAGFVATAQTSDLADRASVVQRLRALVQSGQYQTDSAALSESIVTSTLSGY